MAAQKFTFEEVAKAIELIRQVENPDFSSLDRLAVLLDEMAFKSGRINKRNQFSRDMCGSKL
jgi:hypothetical protein